MKALNSQMQEAKEPQVQKKPPKHLNEYINTHLPPPHHSARAIREKFKRNQRGKKDTVHRNKDKNNRLLGKTKSS